MDSLPIIGITLGDISGIGPEITAKVFADGQFQNRARLVVVGNAAALSRGIDCVSLPLKVNPISSIEEAKYQPGIIDIIDQSDIDIKKAPLGEVSPESGKAAYLAVEKVIQLALEKKVDATVTNPLNKEAMKLAGYNYPGHTEIYASLTNTSKYAMMLAHENLRVIHVSTHVSLRRACELVTKERVFEVISLANEAMLSLGIQNPKIGVCGLNPHAGEHGLFGYEEMAEIIPAIEKAKSLGIDAIGPLPPDTAFSKALGGWYDIVVVMYHDQGHIPVKVKGFVYNKEEKRWNNVSGVNITVGLPIIRVSVDHGTGFDQAGKGTASPESLINSIDYAIRFAQHRG